MSLLLTGIAVAGGVILGRIIGATVAGGKNDRKKNDEARTRPNEGAKVEPTKTPELALDGFPCRLGDVILRSTGDEAWLAGAVVLSETDSAPSLVFFVSPDAGADRVVFARPAPDEELVWLAPVKEDLRIGAEPPSAVEHEGMHFERKRRLPLQARRHGTGAPDVGDSVVFAEYTGLGEERLLVLAGGGRAHVFRGTLLHTGTYDVLPAGSRTLEEP